MQAKRFNIFYFLANGASFDIDICLYIEIHLNVPSGLTPMSDEEPLTIRPKGPFPKVEHLYFLFTS